MARRAELLKHNPRQVPTEVLRATFVGRQKILSELLDELRARRAAPANQHFLITGPRGIGKTNLLLMIRDGILGDEELAAAYLPLQTAEEEYSIASLRDLFARVLDLAMDEQPDDDLAAARRRMDEEPEDDNAAEIGIDALKGHCSRSTRKVALLIDNLQLILGEQLADDAQLGRLRDILMNESFLVLIGAAPTYFKEVSGYDRPFYNFFRSVELEDLSPEGVEEFLLRQAELDGNRKIADSIDELRPRIRAIHHLTGGNPRLVLMLYQLCTTGDMPGIQRAVQVLLDEISPYYKHRLEGLAPQPRRVMDTFARLGRPVTPTELAAETRLKANQVNSILTRLRDLGFAVLAPQEARRKKYYVVSERVFRIWHQMRFATSSRRLGFLVEFLRIWYSPAEWGREAGRLVDTYRRTWSEGSRSEASGHLDHPRHLADAAPSKKERYAVLDRTIGACIRSGDLAHAGEILDERRADATKRGDQDQLAQVWFQTAWLRNEQGQTTGEIEALEKVVELQPDEHEALNNWGCALSDLARRKEGEEQEALLREASDKVAGALLVVGASASAPFYSAHAVHIELARCALAVRERNAGRASELFASALERLRDARDDLALKEIVGFFRQIATEERAPLGAEFLETLKTRGFDRELGVLEPFARAFEYWQKGRDSEVLDRLNPEVREIVESIVR